MRDTKVEREAKRLYINMMYKMLEEVRSGERKVDGEEEETELLTNNFSEEELEKACEIMSWITLKEKNK